MRLVRGTVCHYCLGGCSGLVVCVRRSRHVRGVGARCRFQRLSLAPSPSSSPLAVCVACRPVRVSRLLACR